MTKKLFNKILLWCGVINAVVGSIGVVYNVIKQMFAKEVMEASVKSFAPPPPPAEMYSDSFTYIWVGLLVLGILTIVWYFILKDDKL